MNIHPLFIHFPIGLLIAYSLLEIVAYVSSHVRRAPWVFYTKAFMLFAGGLTALVTIVTGGIAEDIVRSTNPRAFIIDTHEPFAWATTLVYFILAGAYLVRILDKNNWVHRNFGRRTFLMRWWGLKKFVAHLILDTWLLPLLALAGITGITITGALGAALVYGPSVDPIVSFIYSLFWPN